MSHSAASSALAAEPPAIAVPPPPAATETRFRQYSFEASLQESWAGMGEWGDGIAELESRARASGLVITTSTNPAYTTSFDAEALASLRGPFLIGLQYDRLTGKSEFVVRENVSSGGGPGQFPTLADATSNAWLLVGRWMIPGARRGVRPFVQMGAGVGSARLAFSTSSGSAQGKGRGFAASAEAGFHVGDGTFRIRGSAGYRVHRVPLSYSRVQASSQPGSSRYFFDFDDELRDFVTGRDLDLSGAFGRIGVAVALER
ncbi:MAG: hypothetical protein ABIS67_08610 [Candidatus Eisenbacteria bacterium]